MYNQQDLFADYLLLLKFFSQNLPDPVGISKVYVYAYENANNILTFDNSFNYSTSMLNYIGPLFNNSDGFTFLISCTKDLDYLVIDRFNGSIKLLNY